MLIYQGFGKSVLIMGQHMKKHSMLNVALLHESPNTATQEYTSMKTTIRANNT